MTVLHVDTAAMSAGAQKIEAALEQIDNVLRLLNGDVNAMLAGWGGDAANKHRQMHERFQADSATIRNSLLQIHAALLRTHDAYVRQEGAQTVDGRTGASEIMA